MRRLRWATDVGGWELDAETPVTMEGTARAVPGDPLPLGLSRGARITRPKQLDFMHRFMAAPLVPSFAGDVANGGVALLLNHAHTLHLRENWSATILEQLHIQKFLSVIKNRTSDIFSPNNIMKHMLDIFNFGVGTEFWITPNSSLLFETYNIKKSNRSKAIFQHEFPRHNLLLEATSPGLFVDEDGTYWDVPLSMAIDLASTVSPSGFNYHLCIQNNSGQPKHFGGAQNTKIPMSLLPGSCAKAAASIRKHVDVWRKKDGKLKMVQPYDAFLSDPHVSASGVIGAVASVSVGENSARFFLKDGLRHQESFNLCVEKHNFALFGDLFASVSSTVQHGNFQRLILDLTTVTARLDFPSGLTFLNGAACLARNLYHSQRPDSKAIRAICPNLTLSLQQQGLREHILLGTEVPKVHLPSFLAHLMRERRTMQKTKAMLIGPFSFRVDSRIVVDSTGSRHRALVERSIFAIDWALKVLGSARASAWYSPKDHEAMVELRFFES